MRSFIAIAVLAMAALTPARAVIVNGPTGSPGSLWDYVGTVGDASGVYLGEYNDAYWVLTANHVGGGNFIGEGNISYGLIGGSGRQVGALDLYLFQIDVPSGTGLFNLPNLALSAATPSTGSAVTMIGNGGSAPFTPSAWTVAVSGTNATWTLLPGPDGGDISGYRYTDGRTKSWGSNNVAGTVTSNGTTYLTTSFDAYPNEAQAAVGDSGGGMFYDNASTGTQELAGLMVAVALYPGQPANTAVLGNQTYAIDIATYREAILAQVPEPSFAWLFLPAAGVLLCLRRRLGVRRG